MPRRAEAGALGRDQEEVLKPRAASSCMRSSARVMHEAQLPQVTAMADPRLELRIGAPVGPARSRPRHGWQRGRAVGPRRRGRSPVLARRTPIRRFRVRWHRHVGWHVVLQELRPRADGLPPDSALGFSAGPESRGGCLGSRVPWERFSFDSGGCRAARRHALDRVPLAPWYPPRPAGHAARGRDPRYSERADLHSGSDGREAPASAPEGASGRASKQPPIPPTPVVVQSRRPH